jgi:hypothetical protein
MDREIDSRDRPAAEPEKPESRSAEPTLRQHAVIELRGYLYRLSPAEIGTMHDIGRFRTVAVDDLARHQYQGRKTLLRQDLQSLRAQGLVQLRTVWNGPGSKKLLVAVLTKLGKKVLEPRAQSEGKQVIYAGFVKPAEVRHDAAIYRMYQAEKERIEDAGGRIRRVVLDYELKRKVYSPLAKARTLTTTEYAKLQAEVARQNGLTVVAGKIPLPDLRIEYETAAGDVSSVDLEVATGHYHGPALQAKAEAGFKMYAAEGSASRLSRVLEERDIIATILSL